MKDAPILRSHRSGDEKIEAFGGLCYIKGNPKPYFSLTHRLSEKVNGRWVDIASGTGHEDVILKLWPELKPLADLHLCDIDGVPMHAEANGYYWIAGAAGGLGEQYHGGKEKSPEECKAIAANHFRVSEVEIDELVAICRTKYEAAKPDEGNTGHFKGQVLEPWIESKKVQWKMEALNTIQSLHLQVFGDKWEDEA